MESRAIEEVMRLLKPLSVNMKLEVLSKLSNDLKSDLLEKNEDKSKLLSELFGVWSDFEVNDLLKDRSISDKDLSLD